MPHTDINVAVSLYTGRDRISVVVPFGFIPDRLDLLYDVDIEARSQAEKLGLAFQRMKSLNTDPRFMDAMAAAVRSALVPVSRPRSGSAGRTT